MSIKLIDIDELSDLLNNNHELVFFKIDLAEFLNKLALKDLIAEFIDSKIQWVFHQKIGLQNDTY